MLSTMATPSATIWNHRLRKSQHTFSLCYILPQGRMGNGHLTHSAMIKRAANYLALKLQVTHDAGQIKLDWMVMYSLVLNVFQEWEVLEIHGKGKQY